MLLERLKPAVPRKWLLFLAGLMWSGVGAMLCCLAGGWLAAVPAKVSLPLGLAGVVLAVAVYRFGFSRIAKKNIDRIGRSPDMACLFSFQAWKSYLIIVVMVTLGLLLRHSSLPKHYLAVVYVTIGGALFLSSLHYYLRLGGRS